MSHRSEGMDHGLYPYSPLPERPAIRWPGGAVVAANIILHFEYLELDPPSDSVRDARFGDPIADMFPAYRNYSWREYANRIGLFRVLDLLDRHGLKATIAANAMACERCPEAVEILLKSGHDFAAGGISASRMISSRMNAAEERAFIADSLMRLERATGVCARGWIGQDQGESTRTPHLLAEAGLDWVMDWTNDDQPYAMTTHPRSLTSIPVQPEWADDHLLWARRVMPWRYPGITTEALTQLALEGRDSGRYFGLHLHPWIIGKPHFTRHLADALDNLMAVDGVWWCSVDDVHDAFGNRP